MARVLGEPSRTQRKPLWAMRWRKPRWSCGSACAKSFRRKRDVHYSSLQVLQPTFWILLGWHRVGTRTQWAIASVQNAPRSGIGRTPQVLTFKTLGKGRVMQNMAKDSEGRKFNRIPEYVRVQDGKVIHVCAHIRSNRSDCKGQK